MKIFIINLEDDKERFDKTVRELERLRLFDDNEIERMDAVRGSLVPRETLESITTMRSLDNIVNRRQQLRIDLNTFGALGCMLSHSKCWKTIVDRGLPYAMIVEDDLTIHQPSEFIQEWNSMWKPWIEQHSNEFDGLSFSYTQEQASILTQICKELWRKLAPVRSRSLRPMSLEHNGGHRGMMGYVITLRGAQQLLRKVFPLEFHVEGYIHSYARNNNDSFQWYFVHPSYTTLLGPSAGQSRIQHPVSISSETQSQWFVYLLYAVLIFVVLLVVALVLYFYLKPKPPLCTK